MEQDNIRDTKGIDVKQEIAAGKTNKKSHLYHRESQNLSFIYRDRQTHTHTHTESKSKLY